MSACLCVRAQVVESLGYNGVYDLLDELVSVHAIDANPAIKPYTRKFIATRLLEASRADSLLSPRLRKEVAFYLNDYALELDTMPNNWVQYTRANDFAISLAQPMLCYSNANKIDTLTKRFILLVRPVFGGQVLNNSTGYQTEHRWGAEIQMDIANHLSIWTKTFAASNIYHAQGQGYVSPTYDWSQSTGGLAVYAWFGSIGIQKEHIQWGNSQHASIIASANAPSVPMVTLKLTPVRWLEFNYFHAWLTPDAIDTTFFASSAGVVYERKHKYMAANMLTFMPIRYLEFSIGNSIVYAEDNPQAAYFIPIAFYKSLDHLLTKGTGTQNQNSQAFFTISTRNLKYLYMYGSIYLDEFKGSRLKKSNPETNPISFQVGASVRNWPIDGLRVRGEFMRSYIGTYINQVNVLWYTSGGQNLGAPLGQNSQNIYAEIGYRPIRGLDLQVSYINDTRYNQYHCYYKDDAISQKSFKERVWRNQTAEFNVRYEIFNNCFAVFALRYNIAQGFAPSSAPIDSEDRGQTEYKGAILTGDALSNYYLTKYSPQIEQGNHLSFKMGLYYNF